MRKEEKVIKKTVYIARDDKEFYDEDDCVQYEEELAQKDAENNIKDKLGIETQIDFPSMLNKREAHEYNLFLIRNEEDLNLFINVYEYWFTHLNRYLEVKKETFIYPDVLCILDFPNGGDQHRLYKMSELMHQFKCFSEEILGKIKEEN